MEYFDQAFWRINTVCNDKGYFFGDDTIEYILSQYEISIGGKLDLNISNEEIWKVIKINVE